METGVVESARFICSESKNVSLGSDEEFQIAAKKLLPLLENWKPDEWSNFPLHASNLPDLTFKATWIFLIDTLNFAFWTPEGAEPYTVTFEGKAYTGYWSLCAAIKRSLSESLRILDPVFWRLATADDWAYIFRSDNETRIPLFEQRVEVLREAGSYISEKFGGSVLEMIKSADRSAVKLVELVSTNLKSYRDIHHFHGRTVKILKRAQILAADLHYAFLPDHGDVAKACRFYDIDKITMFADYRVPQALVYLGLLKYSPYLLQQLEENPEFPSGSELEIEIRGNSIMAVEKLSDTLQRRFCPVIIDFILWTYAKENGTLMDHIRIHKTSSVFY